jgi:hypothetical protein
MVHMGRMLDENDTPVPNGEVAMTFAIRKLSAAVQNEEAALWASGTCNVNVFRGVYSVTLGESCGTGLLAAALPVDQALYLEISIAGAVTTPRLRLAPVPTARLAARALDADKLGSFPAADYLRSGTDISQLKVGSGPSAPTLDDVLTDTPSLAGGNSFTGANTFSNAGNSFSGSGAGLTSLGSARMGNASSQTLDDALANLSDYARKAGDNAFSGTNTFSAANTFSGANAFSGTNTFSATTNSFTGSFIGDGSGLVNLPLTATLNAAKAYTDQQIGAGTAVAGRIVAAPSDPVACNSTNAGLVYFNTAQNQFMACSGTSSTFSSLGGATVVGPNPSPGAVQVFTYSGADQTFTVPSGVTQITVKMWGAGGGGGSQTGGAGGFTSATVAVSANESITVVVGGGGRFSGVGGYGGGGNGGAGSSIYGAGGGGRSALRRISTELVTAGGGGGGNMDGNGSTGGHGGGASGGTGIQAVVGATPLAVPAGGGTQNAGGAGGQQPSGAGVGGAGGPLQGGNGYSFSTGYYGGGGGGGWYGGGGGTGNSNTYASGGAGGSGYISGPGVTQAQTLITASTNGLSTAAALPPSTGETDYLAGAGVAGAPFGDGGPGLVVVRWTGSTPSAPPISSNSVHGVQVLTATGVNQTFPVPAGVGVLTVKAWGAAGGSTGNQIGGAGGYTLATVVVNPNETLTAIVGAGGKWGGAGGAGGYGGGGSGGASTQYGGGGGGRTALRRGVFELLTAGGGGGATTDGNGGSGGAGGGSTGGQGMYSGTSPPYLIAGGGTQVSGGWGGVTFTLTANIATTYTGQPGTQFTGGNGAVRTGYPGGGGGGGWYGGGGGNSNAASYCSGGGGGSGYAGGPGVFGSTYLTAPNTPLGATSQSPPQTGDSDYAGNAGQSVLSQDGKPGLMVIRW